MCCCCCEQSGLWVIVASVSESFLTTYRPTDNDAMLGHVLNPREHNTQHTSTHMHTTSARLHTCYPVPCVVEGEGAHALSADGQRLSK